MMNSRWIHKYFADSIRFRYRFGKAGMYLLDSVTDIALRINHEEMHFDCDHIIYIVIQQALVPWLVYKIHGYLF